MTGSHKASEEPAAPTAAAAGSTSSTAPPSPSPANVGSFSTAGACDTCDACDTCEPHGGDGSCEPHGGDDAFKSPETLKVASQAAAPATTAAAGLTASTPPPPPPPATAATACSTAVAATAPSSSQAIVSQTAGTAAARSSVRSVAHQGTNPAATASTGEAPAAAIADAGEAPAAATASAGEAAAAAAATATTGKEPAPAAPAAATSTGEAAAGSAAPVSTAATGPTPNVTQALNAFSSSDASQAGSGHAVYMTTTLTSEQAEQLLSAVRSGQRSMYDVLKHLLLHRPAQQVLTLLLSALEQQLAEELLHALAAEQHSLLLALLRIMAGRDAGMSLMDAWAAAVAFDRLVRGAGPDVAVLEADGAVPLLLEALRLQRYCRSLGRSSSGPVKAPYSAAAIFKMAYETSADNRTALIHQLVQAMQPLTQPLAGGAVQQHDELQGVNRAATAASMLAALCTNVPLDSATELLEAAAVHVGTLYDKMSSVVQQLQQLNEQERGEQQQKQQQQQKEGGMRYFGTTFARRLLQNILVALDAIGKTETGRHELAQHDSGPLLAVIEEALSMGVQQHQAGHDNVMRAIGILLRVASMEGLNGLQGVQSDGPQGDHYLATAAAGAADTIRNIAAQLPGEDVHALAGLLQPHVSTLLAAFEVQSFAEEPTEDGSRCIVALLQTLLMLAGTAVGQKALATEEALTVLAKGCNKRVVSPAVATQCLAVLLRLVQAGTAATGHTDSASDVVVQPPDGSQEPLPAASTLPVHMPAAANDAATTTTTTITTTAAPESALSQHPAREVMQSLSQALNPSHVDLLLEAILNPVQQTDFLMHLLAELSVLEWGVELLAPRLQALQGKVQQVLPTLPDDDQKRVPRTEHYLKKLCGRVEAARAERWQRLQQAYSDMHHAAVRCAEVYSMYCSEVESVKLQVLVGAASTLHGMQRLVAAVEHCEACEQNFTAMCGSG